VAECENKGTSSLDWVQYGEKCYYFSNNELTWQSAESFCKQNGGFLVSVHSNNEHGLMSSRVIKLKT
jgi:hypothetical protein